MITPIEKRLDGTVLIAVSPEDLDIMTEIYDRELLRARKALNNGSFGDLREQIDNLSKLRDAVDTMKAHALKDLNESFKRGCDGCVGHPALETFMEPQDVEEMK